jgi:hypothetical protein
MKEEVVSYKVEFHLWAHEMVSGYFHHTGTHEELLAFEVGTLDEEGVGNFDFMDFTEVLEFICTHPNLHAHVELGGMGNGPSLEVVLLDGVVRINRED